MFLQFLACVLIFHRMAGRSLSHKNCPWQNSCLSPRNDLSLEEARVMGWLSLLLPHFTHLFPTQTFTAHIYTVYIPNCSCCSSAWKDTPAAEAGTGYLSSWLVCPLGYYVFCFVGYALRTRERESTLVFDQKVGVIPGERNLCASYLQPLTA